MLSGCRLPRRGPGIASSNAPRHSHSKNTRCRFAWDHFAVARSIGICVHLHDLLRKHSPRPRRPQQPLWPQVLVHIAALRSHGTLCSRPINNGSGAAGLLRAHLAKLAVPGEPHRTRREQPWRIIRDQRMRAAIDLGRSGDGLRARAAERLAVLFMGASVTAWRGAFSAIRPTRQACAEEVEQLKLSAQRTLPPLPHVVRQWSAS
mmetsp:Transcript_43695/g.126266  ORF Transcript_43695/g.126266 Transcript_43695/m.126266 type:complete len:205 (+) Transcript_43695:787-1401(+)